MAAIYLKNFLIANKMMVLKLPGVFCFIFLLVLSTEAKEIPSTVDVSILGIFHPRHIRVEGKDTFDIILKEDIINVNGERKREFFSLENPTIELPGKIKRTYRGIVKVFPNGGELLIINKVKIADYLTSVVGAEMGDGPYEAQKAQAIVSRTFLVKNLHRHKDFDFCDLTHCQVYKGKESETALSKKAVNETNGIVLLNGNKVADVYYHSTCGGKTADLNSIFDKKNTSIISVSDSSYCQASPYYHWDWKLSIKDAPFNKIKIIKRAADGRVTLIEVDGKREKGWQFRMKIARKYGWNTLKSSWFYIRKDEKYFYFHGRGLGHGLGMCQWGAKGMASKKKKADEILKHYFPKLRLCKIY